MSRGFAGEHHYVNLSEVVDQKRIVDGRNAATLTLLVAGAVTISTNGSRGNQIR